MFPLPVRKALVSFWVKIAPVVAPGLSGRFPGAPTATVNVSQYPASLFGEPRKKGTRNPFVPARAAGATEAASTTQRSRGDVFIISVTKSRCDSPRSACAGKPHLALTMQPSSPHVKGMSRLLLPAGCENFVAACAMTPAETRSERLGNALILLNRNLPVKNSNPPKAVVTDTPYAPQG